MPQLIRNRAVVDDSWTLVRDADASPLAGAVIVPLATWRARHAELAPRTDVGVWLGPAEDPADLAADVARLPLIAVDFPQFTDGRGYSIGRLLRERHQFTGELRAIGDIQRDQLYSLAQCGFDAFAIRDGKDAHAALAGLTTFADGYQSTFARTPWFRRRAGSGARHGVQFPVE